MSLSLSPQVVTNGLVFYFDQGNSAKSWKGMPTTNLIVTTPLSLGVYAYASGPSNTTTQDYTRNQTVSVRRYTITSATNTARAATWPYITAGQTYTFSCLIKYNGAVTSSPSFEINASKGYPEGGTNNNTLSNEAWTNTNLGNGWYYLTYKFTATATPTGRAILTYGVVTGSNSAYVNETFDVYNEQFENTSFATPFVSGSRTNTNNIVDMIGGNTITANSLTYNADGSFDLGTSGTNYISFPLSVLSGLTSWTIDFWLNRTVANSASIDTFLTLGSGNNFLWYFRNPDNIVQMENTAASSLAYSVTNGVPFNFTATGSGGIVSVYKNGVFVGTMSNSTTITTGSTIGAVIGQEMDSTSGTFDPAQAFKGKVYSFKAYNRVLSAAEVAQNFNALRGRYAL